MDKIVSLLQSLLSLNKVASVSVPGLLGAVGLAMIFWPPRPIDEIPVATVQKPQTIEERVPTQPDKFAVPKEKACAVVIKPLSVPGVFGDMKQTAVDIQLQLDHAKDTIAQCTEIETSRKGYEKTQNDHLALDIADLQRLLTAALDTYGSYEKSDNPLATRFKAKVANLQSEISNKRNIVLENEQSIRERDLHLAELARYDKVISDRLADPGRLRPRKTFDDVLAALVNHVVAFVLLAIALGMILTPTTQAASAGFFDRLFPEGY